MTRLFFLFFLTLSAALLPAQSRTANINGGRGGGKCTLEVVVDGVTEVEILGDIARLNTLEGRPATWRRFDCNRPMPEQPAHFRFKGIDGRGTQHLLRKPGPDGPSVIRIEDEKRGKHAYTFDILFR